MNRDITDPKYLSFFGSKVAAARHARGEKEDTVAKAIGLTRSSLSKIENGKYESLKITLVIELCRYLELQWSDLYPPLNT